MNTIREIERLFFKYEYYSYQANIPSNMDSEIHKLYKQFLDTLHSWHLTQPEGIMELIKNPSYAQEIFNHSVFDDGSTCTEAAYKLILLETQAYQSEIPGGIELYNDCVAERVS